LEALLSEDCAYTFSHKHLLSADMHSHTANGKPDVLAQLTKTSRSWSDVVRPNTTHTNACPLVHSAQTATSDGWSFSGAATNANNGSVGAEHQIE